VVLRGREIGEVGGLESDIGVGGQSDVKGLLKELGRELRTIAEEQEQSLVLERRHMDLSASGRRSCAANAERCWRVQGAEKSQPQL
jgi:hypothetical protein